MELKMIDANTLPALSFDVAIVGAGGFEDAGAHACFALGVIAGIMINKQLDR
ncbi:hypothetical protein LU699_15535 [Luteimonas fraxinea]|uniref:hypothetical protein n=1 Tax=Luteimonas fraxinea TaxID=2901869 RepID=UPI001E4DE09B|nr:hypothetical protein [Luteimonas fraxinea]UHH09655.1 hypothetical protein LU699_15535 [Luteimonas fraxinea]